MKEGVTHVNGVYIISSYDLPLCKTKSSLLIQYHTGIRIDCGKDRRTVPTHAQRNATEKKTALRKSTTCTRTYTHTHTHTH